MTRASLILGFLAWAQVASADPNVSGQALVLTGARPDLRDLSPYTSVPSYATFDLKADKLDTSFMRAKIIFSGWGHLDPGQFTQGDAAGADFNAAFAQASFFEGDRLTLRAGRQLILGGGARNLRIDGLNADARIVGGLGVSAWAGAVVTPRFVLKPRADFATGARAYYRFTPESEIGASVVMVRDGPGWARQDIGLDARGRVLRQLTLSGYGLWSVAAGRLAEIDARMIYQPIDLLQVLANYRRTAPDLFISRMSIFAAFAEQSRDEAGGEVTITPLQRLSLDGTGYWVRTPSGSGYRASGRLTGLLGERKQTTLAIEAASLRAPTAASATDGYVQLRAFATTRIADTVLVTLDAADYLLARVINGHNHSLTLSGTVSYDIGPAWRLTVVAMGGENPYFSRYFEAMVRATYQFHVGGG